MPLRLAHKDNFAITNDEEANRVKIVSPRLAGAFPLREPAFYASCKASPPPPVLSQFFFNAEIALAAFIQKGIQCGGGIFDLVRFAFL